MFGILKRKALTLLLILSSFLIGCGSNDSNTKGNPKKWNEIQGNTQGTTYALILDDPHQKIKKQAIDSILNDFDLALSTYIDESQISAVNRFDSVALKDVNNYFYECLLLSEQVYEATQGAFDPSVYPLVEAWGFFGDTLKTPTDKELMQILSYVGLSDSNYTFRKNDEHTKIFIKNNAKFKIDFNAIAQGYSVDVLAAYLDTHKIRNYYVEIGGEIVVKGKNRENIAWRLGIDAPKEDGTRSVNNIVHLSNKAIATSGNYRKFYVKDGVKYAHTINPKTGKPVQHSILSATVVADNCALADAYATAFMVMGVSKSMEFVSKNADLDLDIYLLYDNGSGMVQKVMSEGFEAYLK